MEYLGMGYQKTALTSIMFFINECFDNTIDKLYADTYLQGF